MSTTTAKSSDASKSTATSQADTLVSEDTNANFTATGRPMSSIKPSGLGNMPGGIGFTPQAAQHLPVKFHNEDIIPVPMFVAKSENEVEAVKEKHGFMGKMKGLVSGLGKEKGDNFRVVHMPKGDYLKYFAKDDKGNYAGTEPQRSWSDEDLDRAFGQYTPKPKPFLRDEISLFPI